MDFITGLFIGSTFWFWAFILIECVILFACIEGERAILALFSIVFTMILFKVLLGINLFPYIYAHPFTTLLWLAGYVAVGVLYAFIRWDRKAAKWRRRYDEGTDSDKKESMRYIPQASKSKNSIIVWMMYWPISSLWWMISDFVVEFFSTLYQKLSKAFDYIAARHTRGVPVDQGKPRD